MGPYVTEKKSQNDMSPSTSRKEKKKTSIPSSSLLSLLKSEQTVEILPVLLSEPRQRTNRTTLRLMACHPRVPLALLSTVSYM